VAEGTVVAQEIIVVLHGLTYSYVIVALAIIVDADKAKFAT
jgi:hypothetical protein